MRKNKKIKISFTVILTFAFILFFSWLIMFSPIDYFSDKEEIFLIEKGEELKEISFNLKKQGLIRRPFLFKFYVFLLGEESNLKAGKYFITKSMDIFEIAEIFISGQSIKEKITIQEGWDLRDIARYFENRGLFRAEKLFELAGFPAQISEEEIWADDNTIEQFPFLVYKPKELSLEGFLFPDTYEISYGDSIEDIVKRMLFNFEAKLSEEGLFKKIESSGRPFFEILTMASILEKEVISFEDKKIASGVLWKRLKIGMPLQVDASVNYATGKDNRRVPIRDTKNDSLYNTYKYKELPPGPISNPGIESIIAALEPKESPYLYYLSTSDRITIFSETLEEHNIAKAKYLR